MPDVDAIVTAYVECALWAGLDWSEEGVDNPPPLDENYGPDDVSQQAIGEIRAEISDFVEGNAADLDGLDDGQVGHDFYLTRNGHGAGFWDRGLGDQGDRLTAACKPYGESELYVGDDGRLYV